MNAKPVAEKAGWHLLQTSYPFKSEVYDLREDHLRVHEKETSYAYLERAEAVIIVPVTKSGEIILIRQFRYPVDDWCLETPAGGSHDTGDASLEDVVRKELREEIGATCEEVHHVNWFYSAPSMSDEKCHVYLALGAEVSSAPESEDTEQIQRMPMPAREALNLARNGEIKTAPCALALLLCEKLLRERGFLNEERR